MTTSNREETKAEKNIRKAFNGVMIIGVIVLVVGSVIFYLSGK